MEKQIIKILSISKTIALVGASANEKKPSFVVMSYLQSYGYKVLPINPFHSGKKILGEYVLSKLNDIEEKIDLVDVFRPSNETPVIAKEAIKTGAKTFWLQYGIQNEEAKQIVEKENISYIANKCIKQEYQRLFLKVSPVFPALKNI